jgi:hypothetical protein
MTALLYPFESRPAPVRTVRRSRWIIRVLAALIVEVLRQAFGEAIGR